jgi:hypothetical protein
MATYPPTVNPLPAIFNPDDFYAETENSLAEVLIAGNNAGLNQIDMNSQKIILCANPTSAQDVATKNYVDTQGINTVQAGDNITITTPPLTDPFVSVRNPLNAPLHLGTQFVDGSSGYINFATASPTSEAQMSASIGFTAYDSITTGIATTLQKTGLTSQTTTDNINFTPIGITKNVGATTLGITSNTSNITLTPQTAKDCDVVVSGAGKLHIQQSTTGGQALPLCRLTNTNATGSVALEVYKNKPTAVANGDVLFNQSVYGNDSGLAKQEYTRITHTIRDGTAGVEDGSIEFGCFVNNAFSNFLQINGNENEVNCLKNLDMGGNSVRTTAGNMAIDATSSAGTGQITIQPKTSSNLIIGTTPSGTSRTIVNADGTGLNLQNVNTGFTGLVSLVNQVLAQSYLLISQNFGSVLKRIYLISDAQSVGGNSLDSSDLQHPDVPFKIKTDNGGFSTSNSSLEIDMNPVNDAVVKAQLTFTHDNTVVGSSFNIERYLPIKIAGTQYYIPITTSPT